MKLEIIFPLIVNIASKIKEDFSDKQITVDELIDVIKLVVDELGFGDFVILDMSKESKKQE